MSHTLFISGIAVVVYLQQVGIIQYILEAVGAVRINGGENVRLGAAVVAAAADGADDDGQNNNAAMDLVPQAQTVPRGNIPHRTTGGVMTDIFTFFMSLVLSLVPSWTPIAQQPQQPQQPQHDHHQP